MLGDKTSLSMLCQAFTQPPPSTSCE